MTDVTSPKLLGDLRQLIDGSRQRAAVAINSELVLLYWQIGARVRVHILKEARAEYGKEVIADLARALTREYGRGFGRRNLHHMVRFAEVFPEQEIVNALRTQLTWTHLRELIAIDDPLKRQFYTEMCRIERWSTRALKAKVDGLLFERTAISKRPEAVITRELEAMRAQDRVTPDLIFRDPYVLDFLGLAPEHSERDLEAAILQDLERFLLELSLARAREVAASPGGAQQPLQ
ncbi:MAG: DUF1016 domain-containing protein [Alphaproteobacteria bacterium]|nr:DUF1016 domain-containing protein [Alphaproteobacteria bacterium]